MIFIIKGEEILVVIFIKIFVFLNGLLVILLIYLYVELMWDELNNKFE